MGKPTGFIEYLRELPSDRAPAERVSDWDEFHHHLEMAKLRRPCQSATFGQVFSASLRVLSAPLRFIFRSHPPPILATSRAFSSKAAVMASSPLRPEALAFFNARSTRW